MPAVRLPVKYSDDVGVQAFIEAEAWNISPFSRPEFTKTARDIFDEAKQRFGLHRMLDATIWLH